MTAPLELGIVPAEIDFVVELYRAQVRRELFRGPYNLNLFGVRRRPDADEWNDVIGCLWHDRRGELHLEAWQASTDPGVYYLTHPMREAGTAILAPGWHAAAWREGAHKGTYPCLVQARPLPCYRDANRDGVLDYVGSPAPATSGLQIHHGGGGWAVDRWSAGCQVIRWPAALARLMALYRAQVEAGHGRTLSYALFEEV